MLNRYQIPTGRERWCVAVAAILFPLLVFMPAAYGAVEAWSELGVLIAAGLLAVVLAARYVFDRDAKIVRGWVFLPLVAFFVLGLLQLLPLSWSVVAAISPRTAAIQQEMLSDALDFVQNGKLSFYPLETSHHLRLLLVGIVVFASVSLTLQSGRWILGLLQVIFVIGCAEAALAIVQIATGARSIYWLDGRAGGGVVTSGSFVNYSHFCQFMNLSLGAGIGLLMVRVHSDDHRTRPEPVRLRMITAAWQAHGLLLSGLILCALAVLTSMSRNGALALIVASGVIGIAIARRNSAHWRNWLMGLVPLAVLACLLAFGFNAFYARMGTLQDGASVRDRWEMTLGALRAWRDFPIFGSGLGTHEFVFPMYDTALTPVVAAHADNDYAQLLEEMGLLGTFCVATFLVSIAILAVNLMRKGNSRLAQATYGLAFGLVAVAIHSSTDFGQRVPAIFCLSAVFCGLIVALHRVEQRAQRMASPSHQQEHRPHYQRWIAAACCIVVTGACGLAIRDAYAAYLGERWSAMADDVADRIQQEKSEPTDEDFVDLLAATEAAAASEPANVKYAYLLNLHRWQSLSRVVDPDSGRIVLHPDALPFSARIADELTQARSLAPTYGPPIALEGAIRLFVLGDEKAAQLVRRAAKVSSYDPFTCLTAGQLAVRDGNIDEGQRLLNRAVQLNPGLYSEVMDIYVVKLGRPELARDLAADSYDRLQQLAKLCETQPQFASLAHEIRAQAESLLRGRIEAETASAVELATVARIDFGSGSYESAISLYRKALGKDYRQVEWRLQLARCLAKLGDTEAAAHELRICLRLRPRHAEAEKLLQDLSR
jgi:O-antigen ligase/tetratricopeptide (TPR) repeat protein